MEWHGKTMGLIGFGAIAQAVCRLAVALGMRVLTHTPREASKPELGQTFVPLNELLRSSDVVSLHCPLNPETELLMNEDRLSLMKPGSMLINTGRGGLIDEPALAAALRKGQPGFAGLDVLSTEPPRSDNPLLTAPNCLITPHIAWATKESRQRLVDALTENVAAFLRGLPRNVVNG
jgi:glycerate dehydrogenase